MLVNVAMAAAKDQLLFTDFTIPLPTCWHLGEMLSHTCANQWVYDLDILSDIFPDWQNIVNWATEGSQSLMLPHQSSDSFPGSTLDDRGQIMEDAALWPEEKVMQDHSAETTIFADLDDIPARTMSCIRSLELLCLGPRQIHKIKSEPGSNMEGLIQIPRSSSDSLTSRPLRMHHKSLRKVWIHIQFV